MVIWFYYFYLLFFGFSVNSIFDRLQGMMKLAHQKMGFNEYLTFR